MSAPDTNIKTQERRHKPSLYGVKGALIAAGLILLALVIFNVFKTEDRGAVTTGVEPTVATD